MIRIIYVIRNERQYGSAIYRGKYECGARTNLGLVTKFILAKGEEVTVVKFQVKWLLKYNLYFFKAKNIN